LELITDNAKVQMMFKALTEIKSDCGKVCEDFELCAHIACQSSVGAWIIADKVLTEIYGELY